MQLFALFFFLGQTMFYKGASWVGVFAGVLLLFLTILSLSLSLTKEYNELHDLKGGEVLTVT